MDRFETLRDQKSDLLFSVHQFDPPVSPVVNSSQSSFNGTQIIEEVLRSPRVKNAATEIAQKQHVAVDVVFEEIQELLEDIGHTFTLKSIRFVAYFIRKIFRNIYTGIKVNLTGLKKVKELSKELPVILVPSHRSYADFLLVSFVCFIFQLPLPVIAAAQDFKNMTMIGGILRSCGAFYMKRSFRSDELYWTVFFEYVQCLILNSGTTMEFFLEGTRSRSGKSLHPKQGLLSIITDLYFTSRVPDVMFCPVSISYDRVLEESLLARELLGVPKPKESLKGLLKSRSVLSDDYGFAYMYFGKPISLREFIDAGDIRLGKACIPRSLRYDPSHEEMMIVRKLGAHILKKIQDHLIILPNMIVASVLLQNPRGIALDTLIEQYSGLSGCFRMCNIPVVENDGDDCRSAVMESLLLLKSSLTITENNFVCLVDPEDFSQDFKTYIYWLLTRKNMHKNSLGKCEENSCNHNRNSNDKLQKYEPSDLSTVDKDYLVHLTCAHLQLAHQRNQLLHWFYLPAMVVLMQNDKSPISEENLYNGAKMLGDLLCVEVAREAFPSKEAWEQELPPAEFPMFFSSAHFMKANKDFIAELSIFKALGILVNMDGYYHIEMTDTLSFIVNLWSPLLTSYWVFYSYILESCTEGIEYIPDTLIHSCQDFAVSLFLKGVVNYLEIQSLELLKNGLKSLQRLHIVQQLKHHADKRVVVQNKAALYNLTVTIEGFLGLSYSHPHYLASKL